MSAVKNSSSMVTILTSNFRKILWSIKTYFRRRPGFTHILGNSGWLLFDRATRLLLGLLVGTAVARYLGPERFGTLSYAVALVAFFQSVANLGADGFIVRDCSAEPERAAVLIGSLFRLRLFAGVALWIAAVGYAVLGLGSHDPVTPIIIIIATSLLFQAADSIDLWFQSQGQNRRTVTAKFTGYVISNIIKIACLVFKLPLPYIAASYAIEIAMSSLFLYIAYRRYPIASRWRYNWDEILPIIRNAFPMMLSGLAIIIYGRIDQVMIGHYLGKEDLGIYSAGITLSQLFNIFPLTLTVSLLPSISRAKRNNEERYQSYLLLIFRIFGACALLYAITLAIFSNQIIHILYGDAYSAASHVLVIHVFSNIAVAQGLAQGFWYINENKTRIALYKAGIGAASSIIFNFILIPRYGITGAAVSCVISFTISAILSNLAFAPKIFLMQLGIRPMPRLYQPTDKPV